MVPVRVHSGYSLLRGPAGVDDLLARAAELGHATLALTDVNGLYGATVFDRKARAAGLRPIVGAELHAGPREAVALIETDRGYENLCRVLTRLHCGRDWTAAHVGSGRGEEAAGHAWSPFGDLPTHLVHPPVRREPTDPFDLARDLPAFLDGLHVITEQPELARAWRQAGAPAGQIHLGLDPATQTPAQVLALAAAADRLGVDLVGLGSAHLARESDLDLACLLAAMRTGATFDSVDPAELPHPQAVLRGPDRLARELARHPAARIGNRRLAEACGAYRLLPREPVFPNFACPKNLSATAHLRGLCYAGMQRRYGRIWPKAVARLNRELELIAKMGFSEYFLVVWDIVQFARRRGAPVAGRGSGASSVVAYLLGITNVCPLAFDIPFERFLHEGRRDFPDLDVDFCWRIRDDVIDYAFRRWGADHVAMVSMHGTFQEASALRQTAKACGLSDAQISRLDDRALREEPALRRIVSLARRLRGLPTHLSVHPGGIVISRRTLDHHAPIQPSAKGVLITQYDKRGVEDAGLVKLDLLGNRSLSTIRYACELIERHEGTRVDVECLPPGDPATIRRLRAAETVGCNQLESPAMRHLLRGLQPSGVRDLMQALALIRPGAASIGMKEAFIRRARGLDGIPTGHGEVDRILRPTHGVMLYEDDVMLVAAAITGQPVSRADHFRKAVQKCFDDDRRRALSREFLSHCARAGVDHTYARHLWVQMAKFNAYSFCRAHAASYAMLAYAVAYLRTHHPLAFWTAALNNNQSMYHPRVYVEQAKRQGVRFLLPDVNRSEAEFTIADDAAGAIRAPLAWIAGLGPVAVERLLLERRRAGPFANLADLIRRTALGREELRRLILCGALDFGGATRPAMMIELELILSAGAAFTTRAAGARCHSANRPRGASRAGAADQPATADRTAATSQSGSAGRTDSASRTAGGANQSSTASRNTSAGRPALSDQSAGTGRAADTMLLPAEVTVPACVEDYSAHRKYSDQRRLLGFSTSEHIMALYRPALTAAGLVDADSRDLPHRVGRRVRLAGVLEAHRTTRTQAGRPMRFLTLDDEWGLFEVTVFDSAAAPPQGYHHYGPYVIEGRVEQQYDSITLTAEHLSLPAAETPTTQDDDIESAFASTLCGASADTQ